jgi:hypothetical protein
VLTRSEVWLRAFLATGIGARSKCNVIGDTVYAPSAIHTMPDHDLLQSLPSLFIQLHYSASAYNLSAPDSHILPPYLLGPITEFPQPKCPHCDRRLRPNLLFLLLMRYSELMTCFSSPFLHPQESLDHPHILPLRLFALSVLISP